jgi:hypothetical protein
MHMTFELVRWGWPNTVAIIALAMMPIVASIADQRPVAAVTAIEPAAICLTLAECTVVAAAASPETIFE